MKSNSDIRPPKFLSLGDGSYHYNYNINAVESEREDGSTRTLFNYDTVHFWGPPQYGVLVEAVIRSQYGSSAEFALINKYNAYLCGQSTDVSDKEEYEAYLSEVAAIKAMVKADLVEYGK